MNNADLPAMPTPLNEMGTTAHGTEPTYGLTKRERIAIAAMQGFCAAPDTDHWAVETLAECAVRQADALLAQLERSGGEP